MYKGECLNPQLMQILMETGHTDLLCVTDAGFPIPENVNRLDLAWKKGKPGWLEVCGLIKQELVIEKIYLSEDIKTISPQMYEDFRKLFSDTPIEFITHDSLKSMSRDSRAVIRTGEFTSFCNCIFAAGVAF